MILIGWQQCRNSTSQGLAEVIKCGFIVDPEILRLVGSDPSGAASPLGEHTAELVRRAISAKADVRLETPRGRRGPAAALVEKS